MSYIALREKLKPFYQSVRQYLLSIPKRHKGFIFNIHSTLHIFNNGAGGFQFIRITEYTKFFNLLRFENYSNCQQSLLAPQKLETFNNKNQKEA